MKDSFIMFNEHSELVNQLTNEQAGIPLKGLFEYTSTGKEPELDAVSKAGFGQKCRALQCKSRKDEA